MHILVGFLIGVVVTTIVFVVAAIKLGDNNDTPKPLI